jgi:UDP-arabinose 4-epimerase
MTDTTILVTGGAGYIGSHACKVLAQAGYQPVVYDNLARGHREAVRWGPLEVGDVADRARLDAVLRQYQPAAAMHFAAYAYVGESVENPALYYRNNVGGTLTLLEALCDHGLDQLVFSSTCAIYGVPQQSPIAEDHPCKPINPYGAGKWMIEQMLQDLSAAHGLRSISLRYFNAAGADPDGEIGEAHDPETHLLPLVLEVANNQRPYITIHGDDYETPDGTCIRDYIHVTDLAQAHVLALQALAQGANTTAYNLGNGQGFSVREVIERARSLTGHDIPARIGARRPGDPPVLVGNAGRACDELHWRPQYAGLDRIIDTAWRWHSRQAHA